MPEAIGYVHTLHGDAMAGTYGEPRFLEQGDPVYQGEVITTSHNGSLEISFPDHAVLAQGPDSEMVLDEYVYDHETGVGHAAVRFTQGAFRSVTGAMVDQNPVALHLSSPLIDIGVVGSNTAHYVPGPNSREQTGTRSVLVYDGKPMAVSIGGAGGVFRPIGGSGEGADAGRKVYALDGGYSQDGSEIAVS